MGRGPRKLPTLLAFRCDGEYPDESRSVHRKVPMVGIGEAGYWITSVRFVAWLIAVEPEPEVAFMTIV
jgi:hypothetical protein